MAGQIEIVKKGVHYIIYIDQGKKKKEEEGGILSL